MIIPARIESIVQLELMLVLAGLALLSFIFYKIVLRRLNPDRHRLLGRLFQNLCGHGMGVVFSFALYRFSFVLNEEDLSAITRIFPYIGFICILWSSVFFIKLARIFVFEYLFLLSMEAGVPVLLVNIMSLALSLILAGWIATEVFAVRLAPVLATSALISVILGLAIQDTLGNLFAGVALQFDKPYEIGDWIEIQGTGSPIIGQVLEISWRSTLLLGMLDQQITIPNRIVAQSQVLAYGTHGKTFLKGISFRVPLDAPFEKSKKVILDAVSGLPAIVKVPKPAVYFNEVGDSWINLRLVIALREYGSHISALDQVHTAVFDAFAREKLMIAPPLTRVDLHSNESIKI